MRPIPAFSAVLSLLAAMALTGANVAFGKAIATGIPVYTFVLFRFAVASAALAVIARNEAGPRLAHMTLSQRRDLVLMALIGMVGFTICMFEGLKRTAAVDAGIITGTLPAVVAALGACSGDRLSPLQLAAVMAAVTGLLLVAGAQTSAGASRLTGNLLVGGAVLCEALFVVLGKRLAPPYRPLRLALGANLAGLLLAAPLALIDVADFHPQCVTGAMWLLGTWYALAASVVCLWLWYRGLPRVETWLAGLTTAAIPLAALTTSALFLGESIGPTRLIGAGLVMAGIVLGAVSPRT